MLITATFTVIVLMMVGILTFVVSNNRKQQRLIATSMRTAIDNMAIQNQKLFNQFDERITRLETIIRSQDFEIAQLKRQTDAHRKIIMNAVTKNIRTS